MDSPGSLGYSGTDGVYRPWRRDRAATVEPAAAAAVRLARAHLLASAWDAGAVPDPFWRLRLQQLRSVQIPPPYGCAHGRSRDRPHGGHVAGGARAATAGHAHTLWARPIDQREPGAMKRYLAEAC